MKILCEDETDLTLVNEYNEEELYLEIFNDFNITLLDRGDEKKGKDLLVVEFIHKEVGTTNIVAIFTEDIDNTIENIQEDCYEQEYRYKILFELRRENVNPTNK